MMKFPVTEKKLENLMRSFEVLNIKERDLEETFIRSSGPGGQHVNKVSTCVVLVHLPTGIKVRCQKERTQIMNRFHARARLVEKLRKQIEGKQSVAEEKVEKIRRQKRKRSKRAKNKMLDAKKKKGEQKKLRGKISFE